MIQFVNAAGSLWWRWMGPMTLQVILFICIVGSIDIVIRKWAWPPVRYALWLLVFVKLIIPPSWSLSTGLIPALSIRLPAFAESIRTDSLPPQAQPASVNRSARSTETGDSLLPVHTASPGERTGAHTDLRAFRPVMIWQGYAVLLWLAGMVFFLLILSLRIRKLRRWHQRHKASNTVPPWFHQLLVRTAERLGVDRLPAIVFSDEAVTPAVYGVFRPVLLLPESYTHSLTADDAENVLLHELAHLKRGDLWIHGAGLFIQIIYWFNPIIIWTGKRIKHIREICCDLTIASLLRDKTGRYRQTLLETARGLLTESLEPGMGFLGVFEEPFRLVARLRWLEKKTWKKRHLMSVTAVLLSLTVGLIFIPMARGSDKPDQSGPAVASEAGHPDVPDPSEHRIAQTSAADTLQEVFHAVEIASAQTTCLGLSVHSADQYRSDLWIDSHRLAEEKESRRIIVDLEAGTWTYIDHIDEIYVRTSLPFDVDAILLDYGEWRSRFRKTAGRIDPTDRTRTVLNKTCRKYDLALWQTGSEPAQRQEAAVWSTQDVPFDLELYYTFLGSLRQLFNRTIQFRGELEKIEGFQLLYEQHQKRFFFNTVFRTEVVALRRETPPPGIYRVPEGYTQKSALHAWQIRP